MVSRVVGINMEDKTLSQMIESAIPFVESGCAEFEVPHSWATCRNLHCCRIVNRRYWVQNLLEHAFRLQKASNFVDSNDCVGECVGKLSKDVAKMYLDGGHSNISVSEAYATAYSEKTPNILNERIRERDFVDFAYWILCVSDDEKRNNEEEERAWSEYTQEPHTGVRFHFDFPMLNNKYCRVREIEYSTCRPVINLSEIKTDLICSEAYDDFIEKCIFTKNAAHYSWEHELRFLIDDRATIYNCHEVRILHKRESSGDRMHPYLIVPIHMIKKIVFGSAVDLQKEMDYIKWFKCHDKFAHIVFESEIGEKV